MGLTRELSEFQVLGLVGAPDHQPRNDPRLRSQRGKNQRAINGVYDNRHLYQTEHTDRERAMLRLECRAALNLGPRPLFQRDPIEPHALKVHDGLWMSDLHTATDGRVLNALRITHVVAIYSAQETTPLYPERYRTESGEALRFFCIMWDEKREPCVDIKKLGDAHRWITEALWSGGDDCYTEWGVPKGRNNVLIHSLKGCSRAAAVALAMLAPSMERSMYGIVCAKLVERRPAVMLTRAMIDGLITYWDMYARKEDAGIPAFAIDHVFTTTFPLQSWEDASPKEEVRPQYAWEDNTRPAAATSGIIKRDGPLTYSAVFEDEEAEERPRGDYMHLVPVVQAPEDEEDQATEVADAGDVGNALMGDLKQEETQEAINVHEKSPRKSQKSFQPFGYRDTPFPSFA